MFLSRPHKNYRIESISTLLNSVQIRELEQLIEVIHLNLIDNQSNFIFFNEEDIIIDKIKKIVLNLLISIIPDLVITKNPITTLKISWTLGYDPTNLPLIPTNEQQDEYQMQSFFHCIKLPPLQQKDETKKGLVNLLQSIYSTLSTIHDNKMLYARQIHNISLSLNKDFGSHGTTYYIMLRYYIPIKKDRNLICMEDQLPNINETLPFNPEKFSM